MAAEALDSAIKAGMKAIDRAELVSFDLFDTLLCRLVPNPRDVFFLMGARFQHGLGISPAVFSETRVRAESTLRHRTHAASGHWEVNLKEIHEVLANDVRFEICKAAPGLLGWDSEWEVEKALTRSNPQGMVLLEHALAAGKRVVVTSDTYFEEWQARELLEIAGVPLPEQCLVSCERGKSKKAGSLFDDLIAETGVVAENIVHLGDRPDSDVEQPQTRGIAAERLPTVWELFESSGLAPVPPTAERRSAGDLLLLGLLARTFAEGLIAGDDGWQADPARRAGYFSFGPLLLGFTCWLEAEMRRRPVDHVMFLAREGKILKQAFELLGSDENLGIQASYLLTSRLVVRKACLAAGTPAVLFEHLDQIISPYGSRAESSASGGRSQYLNGLGLGSGEVGSLAEALEQDDRSIRELLPGLDLLIGEGAAYQRYVESQLPRRKRGVLGLVDLGWKGTIPAGLRTLIPAEWRLDGYVVASSARASHLEREGLSLSGYLCENGWPADVAGSLLANAEVLETVFSSTTESVWGFRETAGGLEPIFDPRDEGRNRSAFVGEVQDGMLRLVADVKPLTAIVPSFRILPELATSSTLRFLEAPTRREAECMEGVTMTSVGVDSELGIEMAPQVTIAQILRSPRRQLWRVRHCYWEPGFEARTGSFSRKCLTVLSAGVSTVRSLRRRLRLRMRGFVAGRARPLDTVRS